jgi:hypothetical protein
MATRQDIRDFAKVEEERTRKFAEGYADRWEKWCKAKGTDPKIIEDK